MPPMRERTDRFQGIDMTNMHHTTKLLQRCRFISVLYLLMLPTVAGLFLFGYWPKIDAFRFAFYRWEPNAIEEFTGLKNLITALNDARFISAFSLILILLAANLLKMWPSIFSAITLHRLKSSRLRYFFQVLFVVPMVIPGLIWLLLWKGFYDPNVGLINKALNASGLMKVLQQMDVLMPKIADFFYPLNWTLDRIFTAAGGSFTSASDVAVQARATGMGVWGFIVFGAILLLGYGGLRSIWKGKAVLFVALLLPALFIWNTHVLLLLPLVLGGVLMLRNDGCEGHAGDERIRWIGWSIITVGALLVLLTKVWDHQTGAFEYGSPVWLGHKDLVIPAVIFWGFPWVNIIGVLIYLAGLQQIDEEVYEAAELDGVGPWGKIFRIELPLIMTQIRINLIFVTIGTLNGYHFFLILLGPSGGPGGRAMVPGLYMYQQAFVERRFGYGCALGLIMFILILTLTLIYQKFVKVEK